MSPAEQRYLLRVKGLPCVLCLFRFAMTTPNSEAHHCGEHRDHYYVAALCSEHHRGKLGVHGLHRRAFHTRYKTSDEQLVAWTIRLLMEGGEF